MGGGGLILGVSLNGTMDSGENWQSTSLASNIVYRFGILQKIVQHYQ